MNILQARFWSKVLIGDGCWLWDGAVSKKRNIGCFWGDYNPSIGSKASRWAYFLWYKLEPADKNVCHKCDNPRCVRPSHLFLGTQSENLLDMHAKSRHPRGILKSHCPAGHEFNLENTVYYGKAKPGYRPKRTCVLCNRGKHKARRERMKNADHN